MATRVESPQGGGSSFGGRIGPEELSQMACVASMHFREGKTRIEIADRLGISRFKVGRILDKALEAGVIRLEIASPRDIDLELSVALRRRFGFTHALAIPVREETREALQESLGTAAAQLLEEILTSEDVLGLTSGRTLNAMASQMSANADYEVVALSGIAGTLHEHGIDLMRNVVGTRQRRAWPLFAPLIVESESTVEALRRDPIISKTFAQFARVTVGVVAVGSWDPPESLMYLSAQEVGVAEKLRSMGAVGEVAATVFDGEGTVIEGLDRRTMAISAKELRGIPEVIAVAGGENKTAALLGAIRSGLIDSVVTDVSTAQRLLEAA